MLSITVPAGALLISCLTSPIIFVMNMLHLPKIYGLFAGMDYSQIFSCQSEGNSFSSFV